MKAGIYLFKDTIDERRYLVALNGKSPFIRISNAICLNDFANGENKKCTTVIERILNNPEQFELNEISNEIEAAPEELPNLAIPHYNDEQYEKFIQDEYIDEAGNLKEIDVTSQIQASLHVSWEVAQALFPLVRNRYNEFDRWSKIKAKSTKQPDKSEMNS